MQVLEDLEVNAEWTGMPDVIPEVPSSDEPFPEEIGWTAPELTRSVISRVCSITEDVKLHLGELGHAVSNGDTDAAVDHAIRALHAGGPETTGVWGACKLGIGLTAFATGHVILGGAACVWGASAIVGANVWTRNRDYILQWLPSNASENPTTAAGGVQEQDPGETETELMSPTV